MEGRVYLTPTLTKEVIEQMAISPSDGLPQLTVRQREVLRLILEGLRMKEIAATLNLSARTVETHKYQMMQTLGVESTAELVRYAIEHRLITE
jgi:DNA-binding NarL/FixJ family response regulator